MRAKILARSKDRMATVTGTIAHAGAHDEAPAAADSAAAAAAPASSSLSAEESAAALDAALNEISATPNAEKATVSAAAPAVDASAASTSSASAAASTPVADPHEFPSAVELQQQRQQHEADADDDFNRFAQMMQQAPKSSTPGAGAQAAARRRAREAAEASSVLSMPLPPAHSPLVLWQKRVLSQLQSTPPLRMATVSAVLLAGVLAGLGYLEGGFGWLLLVQIVSHSTAFILQHLQSRKNKPAAASRPAPSPPPMSVPSPAPGASASSDPDGDIIDLDTDLYRNTSVANGNAAFPGFPAGFPGFGGAAGGAPDLKALGLPPAMDALLTGAQLLMKYASIMRQVLNDSMIFLFVLVISNAIVQLNYSEKVVHVHDQ